jgi:hypothetical protein
MRKVRTPSHIQICIELTSTSARPPLASNLSFLAPQRAYVSQYSSRLRSTSPGPLANVYNQQITPSKAQGFSTDSVFAASAAEFER